LILAKFAAWADFIDFLAFLPYLERGYSVPVAQLDSVLASEARIAQNSKYLPLQHLYQTSFSSEKPIRQSQYSGAYKWMTVVADLLLTFLARRTSAYKAAIKALIKNHFQGDTRQLKIRH
jgi:hypothetical protein